MFLMYVSLASSRTEIPTGIEAETPVEKSTLVVLHSLSPEEPACPDGFEKEYSGYSFSFANGYGFSLGKVRNTLFVVELYPI